MIRRVVLESLQQIIVPLLKKCSEQSYRIGDETLTSVAKNLGSWCYNLREVLSPQDRAWFLSMYTRLAGVDDNHQQPANRARQGPLPLMTQSDPDGLSLMDPVTVEDPGHVACRRMCAYNFPVSWSSISETFLSTLLTEDTSLIVHNVANRNARKFLPFVQKNSYTAHARLNYKFRIQVTNVQISRASLCWKQLLIIFFNG
jgi:hypothetical protein